MSEWKEYKVTDFSQILSGTTPSSAVEEYWNGNIIWITPVDLSKTTSRYIETSERKITKKGLDNSSRKVIPAYSIVMSSRAPIGYFAIATNAYTTNQGCKSFVLNKDQDPDFHYYNFLLNKNKFLNLGSGSTFQEISKSSIQKLFFTIPTFLPEQRAIAAMLITIDETIEATEKIIAKRHRVKEGLMQDLFRYGLDDKGKLRSDSTHRFKNSPLGRIPEEWEVVRLEKITYRIGDGLHSTPNYTESSDYYFINGNNLGEKVIRIYNDTKCISVNEYNKFKSPIDNRTILLSINGTIGSVSFYNNETVVLGKSAAYINLIREISKEYIYYLFKHSSIVNFITNELTGTTIKNLSLKSIRSIPVKLPKSQSEQSRIAAALTAADEAIEKEEAILEKLKAQKRGLMEDLLTGKVRVTEEMVQTYGREGV
jgi:type I restriction enzyme S subunit